MDDSDQDAEDQTAPYMMDRMSLQAQSIDMRKVSDLALDENQNFALNESTSVLLQPT